LSKKKSFYARCELSTLFNLYVGLDHADAGGTLANGFVVWFNKFKGYGFIRPDGGGKDVFVHMSAVEEAGISTLIEGQRVSYELASVAGKVTASQLRVGTRESNSAG